MITKLFETIFTINTDDDINEIADDAPSKIQIANYTWTKIGQINGYTLYLCDEIVKRMKFANYSPTGINTNLEDYKNSNIREWLTNDFYNKLSPQEKLRLIKNEDNDKIFILNLDEYKKFKQNIPNLKTKIPFWLKTKGYYKNSVAICTGDDYRFEDVGNYYGIRPAILLP